MNIQSRDASARDDFDRALNRGFWRRVGSWLMGRTNTLLPFDAVRERLPIRAQRHVGLQQVPIDRILGSVGRYRDFDRAFFPTQSETRDRWMNISRARYADVPLPPVDLYRMGEIYFVKDGNHRVSVARERGQEFVDAYVIEIDVPVPVDVDTDLQSLELARAHRLFLEDTGLDETGLGEQRPELDFTARRVASYEQLREHIHAHRWFATERSGIEPSAREAAASWADEIYRPMVEIVRQEGLLTAFPGATEVDLYLWISRYQDFLRAAHRNDPETDAPASAQGSRRRRLPLRARRLARLLGRPEIRQRLLEERRILFLQQTGLPEHRPDADLHATLPHAYETLSEHISVHRWYLGETRGEPAPYEAAALSWFDQVYQPLVEIVRDQDVLAQLPERTETDIYLWVSERRELLEEQLGEDITLTQAVRQVAEQSDDDPSGPIERSVTRVIRTLADAARKVVD